MRGKGINYDTGFSPGGQSSREHFDADVVRPARAPPAGYPGLRATPPHRAAAAADSASDRGRHLESCTTPGSIRSSPSKKPVTRAWSRSTRRTVAASLAPG